MTESGSGRESGGFVSEMYEHTQAAPGGSPDAPFAARIAALIVAGVILAGLAIPGKIAARQLIARSVPSVAAAEFRSADVNIGSLPVPERERIYIGKDGERVTVERIRSFLARQRSPMTGYADVIVSSGMKYGVDPRVIVAIAGVESTYGRYSSGYNAWGWGKARWSSWSVAIERYTRALGSEYRSLRHGRFAAASRTYCPPCGKRWGIKALGIFNSI